MGEMADYYLEQGGFFEGDWDESKTCKYCNKTGLYWDEFPGLGWRLVDLKTMSVHECKQYDVGSSTKVSI